MGLSGNDVGWMVPGYQECTLGSALGCSTGSLCCSSQMTAGDFGSSVRSVPTCGFDSRICRSCCLSSIGVGKIPGKSCCVTEDRGEGTGDVHICMRLAFRSCSQVRD